MSIYVTLHNSGTSNPIFKEKEIPDRMPGQMSEIPIIAFPGSKKVNFDLLLTCLPALLNSQITCTGTFGPKDTHNIFSKVTDLPGLRFFPPLGYFTFQGLSEEDKALLHSSGLTEEPSRPATFVGCPTFDKMSAVYALEPSSTRIPPDYASTDAILAYTFLIKGLALYSAASHAMAYSYMPLLITTDKGATSDKGEAVVEFGCTKDTVKFSLDAVGYSILPATKPTPITVPIDNTRKFLRGITTSTAPKIRKVNEGGRFFPYFDGMTLPDRFFAYQVFADIFPMCLSDNVDVIPDVLNRIRIGCLNLAKTKAGMALSHAYMGIKLSKQAHSYITFIISKGVYQGFVLEGDFKVIMGGRTYAPHSFTEIEHEVSQSNKHDVALAKIKALFELARSTAGTILLPTAISDIDTSRNFIRHYRNIQLSAYSAFPDFAKDLRKAVEDLSFNEVYEPLSYGTLKTFLQYVNTGDESLLDNLPGWIHGGYFEKSGDRVAVGLGIFGNVALSINYGGDKDQKFTLPIELGVADPNLAVKADGTRVLAYLPVKKVELTKALGQWNRLFQTGTIQIKPGRKGKKEFTDRREVLFDIGGQPQFPETYGLLKGIVLSRRVGNREKRRAEATGSTSGSSSAAKKAKGKQVLGSI